MKCKCIIVVFAVVLLCLLGTVAKANTDQYIVYLKQKPRLFSTQKSTNNKRYEVMAKDKLSKYLDENMVEYYEPDCEIKLFDDFLSNNTSHWNMKAIKVKKAWDIGCYGNEVRVGIIDSGVYAHEDLTGNLLNGHNYTTNDDDTTDNIGHGTFVAGIIAAEANEKYIEGIAYHAKIVPLKCFDRGYTTTASDIANAVYDAIEIYHCDVLNMSFGMDESLTSQTLRLSIEYAQNNGCIVIAAVGNDGTQKVYYPAKYVDVVGVGALDRNNKICYFSQKNETVDVVAPGSNIESVSIPSFTNNSGTSFSAPHVTAMAAIAKCINKNINQTEFNELLKHTSTDLGENGYDTTYGYGLINIESMLDNLLENTPVFMSQIEIVDNSLKLRIYNNTGDELKANMYVAGYEENKLLNLNLHNLDFYNKEIKEVTNARVNNVKFMLWDSGLKPLTQHCEYKK